jgi:hypothetical protein
MSNINARRVAAERLRAAFAPELAAMRRWHADKAIDREQLLKAVPFFPRTSRDAYQAAWQGYYEDGGSVRFYDYFMRDDGPEIFVQRIEAILNFAAAGRRPHTRSWHAGVRLSAGDMLAASACLRSCMYPKRGSAGAVPVAIAEATGQVKAQQRNARQSVRFRDDGGLALRPSNHQAREKVTCGMVAVGVGQ